MSVAICRATRVRTLVVATIYLQLIQNRYISWLHRASNNVETFSLPTDAHNVKKHRVIKTF